MSARAAVRVVAIAGLIGTVWLLVDGLSPAVGQSSVSVLPCPVPPSKLAIIGGAGNQITPPPIPSHTTLPAGTELPAGAAIFGTTLPGVQPFFSLAPRAFSCQPTTITGDGGVEVAVNDPSNSTRGIYSVFGLGGTSTNELFACPYIAAVRDKYFAPGSGVDCPQRPSGEVVTALPTGSATLLAAEVQVPPGVADPTLRLSGRATDATVALVTADLEAFPRTQAITCTLGADQKGICAASLKYFLATSDVGSRLSASSLSTALSMLGTTGGFTSPDVKVVRYIRDFTEMPVYAGSKCVNELADELSVDVFQAITACIFLQTSHNPDPPGKFTDQDWQSFKDSKEYRGYVHIPPVSVGCNGDTIATVNGTRAIDVSHNASGAEQDLPGFEESPGYTPQRPAGDGYEPADVPDSQTSLGIFNSGTVRMRLFNQDKDVLVSYLLASRISEAGRVGAGGLLGFDAPFIWTVVQERITCHNADVAVVETEFPTGRLYIDDKFATETFQAHLANFIRSGGTTLHQLGEGRYASDCRALDEYHTPGTAPAPVKVPDLGADNGCATAIIAGRGGGPSGWIP